MSEKIINISDLTESYPTLYECSLNGDLVMMKELCELNRLSIHFMFSTNQDDAIQIVSLSQMYNKNRCIYDSIMNSQSIYVIKSLCDNYGYSVKLFFMEKQ